MLQAMRNVMESCLVIKNNNKFFILLSSIQQFGFIVKKFCLLMLIINSNSRHLSIFQISIETGSK